MKRKRKKNKSRSDSWVGNLLLELVAVAALLFVLAMSKGVNDSGESRLSYQTTGVGSAVTDFLKDQIEYQRQLASE